jgi:hypothetical protein
MIRALIYITVCLALLWIVLDLAEARRVASIIREEQKFTLGQRAICKFMLERAECPVIKRVMTYNTIQYCVYEPRDMNESTQTIVFIPGALQSPDKHEYVPFRLACMGIRSLFMPLSIIREPIESDFDESVVAALKFVDHVRETIGPVSCIIGHSLGGLIALRIALVDSKSLIIAFSPYLGLEVSPASVIAERL